MQKEEEHEKDGEAGDLLSRDDDDHDRDVEHGQPSGGGAHAVPLDLGGVQQGQATGGGCSAVPLVLEHVEQGHVSGRGHYDVLFLQRGGGGPLN